MAKQAKHENFINGKIFKEGIQNALMLNPRLALALVDTNGVILATSAKTSGSQMFKDFEADGLTNGGTLTINMIEAKNTDPFQDSSVELADAGKKATHFLIAEWEGDEAGQGGWREEGGSLLDKEGKYIFPKGDPVTEWICGALSNGPYVNANTSFQFNTSTITFSIS